jgi:carbon-monoxide dehydrogenase small subunit
MATIKLEVKINGKEHRSQVEPRLLLVHYLRDLLNLTETRISCETTLCGACTVLLDGRAVKSCTVLAAQADGHEIQTVEGLSGNGKLHPVQEAFAEHHGFQCGYCRPGMILTAVQLLRHNPKPTEPELRRAIAGNLCRCTGYQHIVAAIDAASKKSHIRPGGSVVSRACSGSL